MCLPQINVVTVYVSLQNKDILDLEINAKSESLYKSFTNFTVLVVRPAQLTF